MNLRQHRGLLVSVYLPTMLFSFGQGLLVPILPLYAADFHGSYALAGFVVAAGWVGQMAGDLPAGILVGRIGSRRAMVLGGLLVGVATVALAFATTPFELITLRLLAGIGIAFFAISRFAFIASVVGTDMRGRAISLFGGTNRIGHIVGPVTGGFIASLYGLSIAIVMAGTVLSLTALLSLVIVRDLRGQVEPRKHRVFDPQIIRDVVMDNPRQLAAGGTAQILAHMIRAGKQIIIPLYGAFVIGLGPAQIGQILAISSAIGLFLFVPAGVIMDRWGRKAAAVPSFAIMGTGMLLIPLSHSYLSLMLVGLLLGFGHGIGIGTLMTLGTDLAPPGKTGEFLGLWRLIGDGGHAIAPMAVGVFADSIGLVLTTSLVGGIGFISAGTLAAFVRETRWSVRQGHGRKGKSGFGYPE